MDKQIMNLITHAINETSIEKGVAQIVNNKQEGAGNFFVKTAGIVSGIDIVEKVFNIINPSLKVTIVKNNSDYVNRGDVILSVKGRIIDILKAQKVVINFLQLLSGVATIVDKYSEEIKDLDCKILSNYKGLPIINSLYFKAFEDGGGEAPSEYIKIDEYQVMLAGSVTEAVHLVQKKYSYEDIEIYVKTKEEFEESLNLNIKRIILESTEDALIEECLQIKPNNIEFGVSGNFSIGRIRSLAKKGIKFIIIDNISSQNKGIEVCFKLYKKSLI